MKCSWCGSTLEFYADRPATVGMTFVCRGNINCPNLRIELAVPQIGSAMYDRVMKEQSGPNWKPILERRAALSQTPEVANPQKEKP
jgi:hypothetical protein